MKIAVGSKNPVKINAVRNIFQKVFNEVEIISVEIPSGVNHQPMSDEETIEGAINRAKEAIKHDADFGVGLEGGIHKMKHGYFLTNWCAIVDKNEKIGIGGGSYAQLPEKIMKKVIEEGKELGTAMDELTGVENTKQRIGSVGFLTKELSSRQTEFESIVALALAKFISPEFYE